MDIYLTKDELRNLVTVEEFYGSESEMKVFLRLPEYRKYKDLIVKHYKSKSLEYLDNKKQKVDYMKNIDGEIVMFPKGGLYVENSFEASLYTNLGVHYNARKFFNLDFNIYDIDLKVKMLLAVNKAFKEELHPKSIYTYDLHSENVIYVFREKKFYMIDVCGFMVEDIPTSHKWVNCDMVKLDYKNPRMRNEKFFTDGEIIFGKAYDMKVLYEMILIILLDLYMPQYTEDAFVEALEEKGLPYELIEESLKAYNPNQEARYLDDDFMLKLASDYKIVLGGSNNRYYKNLKLERKS